MSRRRQYADDDGRVIADMSAVLRPGLTRGARGVQAPKRPEEAKDAPTARELRTLLLGAMAATLCVAAVFLTGAVLFLLFCTRIWLHA